MTDPRAPLVTAARLVHLIGVPCDFGGNRRGAADGPAALRRAGLIDRLATRGQPVRDLGDLAVSGVPRTDRPDPRKRFIHDIAAVGQSLYDCSLACLRSGGLPIALGGDHSVSAGSVAASATHLRERAGKPLGLIWIDAHGDMNTPETTLTGNVHGMPLAAILGREPRELAAIGGWMSKVAPEHTVLFGLRSVDDLEWLAIREAGIRVFTMNDIRHRGIVAVMLEALAVLNDGTGGVHVSLDLDVCDPTDAPGVTTPEREGITAAEALAVMQMIGRSSAVVSIDIVEVNPVFDIENATAHLAVALTLALLGRSEA